MSDELWEKAQEMLDKRLHDMSIDQSFIELTEENYPHKNKLFCAKCGYKLCRRKSGGGKGKTIWYCGGARNYGQGFCSGVSVTDLEVRRWGSIEDNIYITDHFDELGKVSYSYVKEEEWYQEHQKKSPPALPALTLENYPFLGMVYCKKCGMQLTRCFVSGTNGHIRWKCLGSEKYGKKFCEGISIPDEILQKVGEPKGNIFVGKEIINGEERYGYTSKPDQVKERPRRKK